MAAIEIENENESTRNSVECVLKLSLINVLSFSMTSKLSLKSIGSAIEVLINAIALFFLLSFIVEKVNFGLADVIIAINRTQIES